MTQSAQAARSAPAAAAASAPARAPRLDRMPWGTVLLLVLPALLLYGTFVVYPIVQSARYSLFDWDGLEALDTFVGLDNFRRAFADPLFRGALTHNVILMVLGVGLQIPFALTLAVLLNSRIAGRAAMRTIFFAPYILSEVVTGVVWRQVLRPGGFLDQSLAGAGADSLVQGWLSDPDIVLYSVFVVVSWKYFGFHMVIMLAGLQAIPTDLKEAAAIDGASTWQTFRRITLPLLAPTIRVSVFLSMIGVLQLFDMVWVTTKGGPLGASSTMATYLYDQFRKSLFGYASAVSILIFAFSLLIALGYQRFALRRDLEGAFDA